MSEPKKPKKPIVFPEIDCSGTSKILGIHDLYVVLQETRQERWLRLVLAYEADKDSFFDAWHWLNEHPVFYYFGEEAHERSLVSNQGVREGLEFMPTMVNPETRTVSDDDDLNTKVDIWVEVFPASLRIKGGLHRFHDVSCDTGGSTYEEAVIMAAKLIYDEHGNDREALKERWDHS